MYVLKKSEIREEVEQGRLDFTYAYNYHSGDYNVRLYSHEELEGFVCRKYGSWAALSAARADRERRAEAMRRGKQKAAERRRKVCGSLGFRLMMKVKRSGREVDKKSRLSCHLQLHVPS
jgi:hypothetical protein